MYSHIARVSVVMCKCGLSSTSSAYPVNTTSAPTFTVTPVNTLAYVGTRALIECLGHAHPTPTLEWIIIHDVRFPREGSVLPTGTLQFDAVVPEDAGTYRCRLSNSVGADYVDVTLEVRGERNGWHFVKLHLFTDVVQNRITIS